MTSPILLPHTTPVSEIADPVGLLQRAGILMTPEQERLDAIERARYVLVRNDGDGERWRCGRCGAVHVHYTLMCIERPFRGLTEGLLAYWRNAVVRDADLTPGQRRRRSEAAGLLGMADALPNLADLHPRMAREVGTREGSTDYGALLLGTIDPITDTQARLLASRINAKARRTVVRL